MSGYQVYIKIVIYDTGVGGQILIISCFFLSQTFFIIMKLFMNLQDINYILHNHRNLILRAGCSLHLENFFFVFTFLHIFVIGMDEGEINI